MQFLKSSPTSARFGRFFADNKGTIAVMAAVTLPVVIGAAALAVDLGALYLDRRAKQGAADLAAMAAAADIDKSRSAALTVLAANGIPSPHALDVVPGHYQANAAIAVDKRFLPNQQPFNAVQVRMTTKSGLHFARLFSGDSYDLHVSAIAMSAAQASFSAGSRLLAIRDGIPNKVLSAILGSQVSVSAVDYDALLQANVQLAEFLDTLGPTLGVTAGTYDDILRANATVGQVLSAALTVAERNGNTSTALALRNLLNQTSKRQLSVPLNQLIDLGPFGRTEIGGKRDGLGATLSAMDLVMGAIVLASKDHQVEVDLGATIPGLSSVKLTVTVGERPVQSGWVSVGSPGAEVATAQIRLKLVAEVGGQGVLANARIRLPVEINVAHARARLASVECTNADSRNSQVTIAAWPGVLRAVIADRVGGTTPWFGSQFEPARLVDTPLLKLKGRARIAIERVDAANLSFDKTDIDNATIKRADTNSYARSLVSALLKDLRIEAEVAGLTLVTPDLATAALQTTLSNVAKPLDDVVHGVLSALGVRLGEVDVKVHGVRCGSSVLAQ